MATKRTSGDLDHLTTVPENFDPDPVDDGDADGETDVTDRSDATPAERTVGRQE